MLFYGNILLCDWIYASAAAFAHPRDREMLALIWTKLDQFKFNKHFFLYSGKHKQNPLRVISCTTETCFMCIKAEK